MGSNGCRDSDVFLSAMPTVIAAAKDWWVRYQSLTQGSNCMKTHLHVREVPLYLEADRIKDYSKRASRAATLSQGIILSSSWLVSNSRLQYRSSNREHPS